MAAARTPHAIIIPLPHQGHINPSIDLALKLATTGVVVTFVNLEFAHHQMLSKSDDNDDIFHGTRGLGLDIRYRTIPDGFPPEFDRVLHLQDFWEHMLTDFPARVDELVGELIGSDPGLDHFLIVDTLFGWPATVAKKYNLVYVSLWTEPAIVFSLIYHAEILRQHGHFPCRDDVEEEIDYVPGIKSVNTKNLMPYLRASGLETTSHRVVFAGFKEGRTADFVLHNTVEELESDTLSALNEYQRSYAIGPVYFSVGLPTDNLVRRSLLPESNCTEWLHAEPPGSVLYVSFGSLVQISKREITEIAHGLLLSGVKFIWAIRGGILGPGGAGVGGVLPEGFVEGIKERGVIVSWCNQMKVLGDPAVGGFLTHCGWNSVLESVWCGVPMICYPLDYDQPMVRKLVVEDWKVGIDLREGVCVDRNEVGEKIRSVIVGGSAGKESMVDVRGKMKTAVEMDAGSSQRNFTQFVADLKEKIGSS